VDAEAEVIIGAIQDPSLDGKIRVSIVATALDGQKPESKSVINMVHRIQNRNPGYSDFSNTGSAQSFNFSPTMSSPISHGANALKLENEVVTEQEENNATSQMISEEVINTQENEANNIIENSEISDHEQSFAEEALNNIETTEENSSIEADHSSNGLENFGVDEEMAPDLFNDNVESVETQGLLSVDSSEDNDLEIPAFLRRQKN